MASCFGLSDSSDEGAECQTQEHCEDLCSPLGECVSKETALDIRINWTVDGLAPTPANASACASIANLEVRFESDSIREEAIAYFPVPCENGTVFYPSMPPRLRRAIVSGLSDEGSVLAQEVREIVEQNSQIAIDLKP